MVCDVRYERSCWTGWVGAIYNSVIKTTANGCLESPFLYHSPSRTRDGPIMSQPNASSHPTRYFDPDEHARAKQLSREADERALASGEKTREQLRAENAIVRISYDELVIDFSQRRPGSLR